MEIVFSILIILILILWGLLLTYFFKFKFLFEERVILGSLIAFIFWGYLMLVLSLLLGLNFFSLLSSILLITLFSLPIFKKGLISEVRIEINDLLQRLQKIKFRLFILFLFCLLTIFSFLASQLLISKDGNLYVQPVHSYGDISLHLGIISSFAYADNFLPQNPVLSGTPLSYPFLVDFITAIFVNPLSLSLEKAISLTGVLFMIITISVFAFFVLRLTKSYLVSALSTSLFLFNGGLGFVYFFKDLLNSNSNFFYFLSNLLKVIKFFQKLILSNLSMLLPQRSFLMGLPISLLILLIFINLKEKFLLRQYILGILLISLLPLIHAHSLIVLIPFLIFLTLQIFLKSKEKKLPIISIGLLGVAVTLLISKLFLEQSTTLNRVIRFQVGWMVENEDLIKFYIKNFGVVLFLVPISLIFGIKKKFNSLSLTTLAQLWFILPTFFVFQPWAFDNIKLYIYWYIFSAISVSRFLVEVLKSKKVINVSLFFILVLSMVFSGFLDNFRLLSSSETRYQIYSSIDFEIAEFVKENISPYAIFLSTDKFDNPVVTLAGRRVVMGFRGWLWTHGLNYQQRELDVKKMLSGEGNETLFEKYNISHVVLFNTKNSEDFVINSAYFKDKYELIYSKDGYEIYQL